MKILCITLRPGKRLALMQCLTSLGACRDDAGRADLKRQLEEREEELRLAQEQMSTCQRRASELAHELAVWPPSRAPSPPPIDPPAAAPAAAASKAAADELVNMMSSSLDVVSSHNLAAINVAMLKKYARERNLDPNELLYAVLQDDGMKVARDRLIHEKDLETAEHLRTKVYAADRVIAILRILPVVGGISKRVCGLIQQTIDWVHTGDRSTREPYTLRPDSKVAAPSLFSISGINVDVKENQPDRQGADESVAKTYKMSQLAEKIRTTLGYSQDNAVSRTATGSSTPTEEAGQKPFRPVSARALPHAADPDRPITAANRSECVCAQSLVKLVSHGPNDIPMIVAVPITDPVPEKL